MTQKNLLIVLAALSVYAAFQSYSAGLKDTSQDAIFKTWLPGIAGGLGLYLAFK